MVPPTVKVAPAGTVSVTALRISSDPPPASSSKPVGAVHAPVTSSVPPSWRMPSRRCTPLPSAGATRSSTSPPETCTSPLLLVLLKPLVTTVGAAAGAVQTRTASLTKVPPPVIAGSDTVTMPAALVKVAPPLMVRPPVP